MKPAKLSDAIKAGAKQSKQAYGAFFGTDVEHDLKIEFMDTSVKYFGDGSGAIMYGVKNSCLYLYDPDKMPFAIIPLTSIKLLTLPSNETEE